MFRKSASLAPDRPQNGAPRISFPKGKGGWAPDLGRSLKRPLGSDKGPGSFEGTSLSRAEAQAEPDRKGRKRLSLALQGGGGFGPFRGGVRARLLEEDIDLDAVSGASAGAINAVLLVSGLARGGRPEARASLDRFWQSIGDTALGNLFVSPEVVAATAAQLSPY